MASDPISTDSDKYASPHSTLEHAPYQVTRHSYSHPSYPAGKITDDPSSLRTKQTRNPWGLSPVAFGLLIAAITAIIVGAAVGGGVGGALSSDSSSNSWSVLPVLQAYTCSAHIHTNDSQEHIHSDHHSHTNGRSSVRVVSFAYSVYIVCPTFPNLSYQLSSGRTLLRCFSGLTLRRPHHFLDRPPQCI